MHDGKRFEVEMFMRLGEDLEQFLEDGQPFLPVVREGRVCLIARAAIACIGVPLRPRLLDDELPVEEQRALVELTSGVRLDGRLQWTSAHGRQRTIDYLNEAAPYLAMHMPNATFYVAKTQIACVEER